MSSPPPPPAAPQPLPPLQGQQNREAAARWLYEHVLYDLGEQMRINRAAIAQSRGLNPLAYSQPLPIVAPPQQMPAPVAESAANSAGPPVDSMPLVKTQAASAPIVNTPTPAQGMPPPAAPTPSAQGVTPVPPPPSPPVMPQPVMPQPASPAPAAPQPASFLLDWSVDPKTGKLITSVRPSPNGGG